jgi:phospho-N-acetylmuramoyl-pentapeptide-transferase
MLFHFLPGLASQVGFLNVFKYLTFRTGGAVLTALILSFVFGSPFIRWLKSIQKHGQPIREDGPKEHLLTKKGTPTMGGVLILLTTTISTLLWGNLRNVYLWVVLFITLGFGLIGAYDDYLKLTKQSSQGLPGKYKLILQGVMTMLATYIVVGQEAVGQGADFSTSLAFPFFKDYLLNLGGFFYVFSFLVIVGASNAVNLTDGLDGLAIMPIVLACACFALISYLVGNVVFSNYLQIHHITDGGELAVFCGAMIGAGLGFLWYNAPPAKVFMGDTGSLAAGGALGTVAMITKHEIVLAIIGGLFVLEAISVIIQVGYYKLTHRRIFLMAPIHHHFEKKGWAEATIVIRFWIIATILALVGLSTLKLR